MFRNHGLDHLIILVVAKMRVIRVHEKPEPWPPSRILCRSILYSDNFLMFIDEIRNLPSEKIAWITPGNYFGGVLSGR